MMHSRKQSFGKLLGFANLALVASLLTGIVTVVLAYPLAEYLPMAAQVGAHISTLICATTLKLSYVLRLVSLRGLVSLNAPKLHSGTPGRPTY